MMNNTKYYVETDFTKKIKLKKNKPFLLNFNRSYDLYSDLIIEYEIGNKNDFKGIYRLPKEINNIIKLFLKPICNVDMFLYQGNNNLLKAENIYINKKNFMRKKINLHMLNNGNDFFSFVSNHLPIVSIQYHDFI